MFVNPIAVAFVFKLKFSSCTECCCCRGSSFGFTLIFFLTLLQRFVVSLYRQAGSFKVSVLTHLPDVAILQDGFTFIYDRSYNIFQQQTIHRKNKKK
jgi:hypothetical protein